MGEPQRVLAVRGEPQRRHVGEEAAEQLDGAGVIVDEQNLLRLRWFWHEPGIQPEGARAYCEARHGPHQDSAGQGGDSRPAPAEVAAP
jgi:hypothetical protein